MTTEITPNANENSEDSPVLKALRAQIKDLEKELKARPAREEVEAEVRTKLNRESAAAALLIEQGQSAGLAEYALQKIGDAEVTAETVTAFLQGIGVAVNPVSAEAEPQPAASQQLADVTSLAGKVASAAAGGTADSLAERLGKAQSKAEVQALMAEAGLVQSE